METVSLPAQVHVLGLLFEQAGAKLYAVGGLVRNALLGYPPSDWDICGPLTPEEAMRLADRAGIRAVPKAIEFGTIELHMDDGGETKILEYTTFRQDSYTGSAHRPEAVSFSASMEQDAFRRDFTVNALYADAATGAVYDPTGGIADLRAKVLRVTNPDPDAIMRDDGLRVLRLVRFACEFGFSVEPASYEAARRNAAGLSAIAKERITQEMKKLLLSDIRYGARQPGGEAAQYRALRMLEELGALAYVFPELLEGAGIEQRSQYHAYDVLNHNLHACECAPPVLVLRLAALLHDVAKPRSLRDTGMMLGHDKTGAALAGEMLERLRFDRKTTERVRLLIAEHMFDLEGRAKEKTLRKHFARLGYEASLQLADLREADVVGSGRTGKPVATAEKFRAVLQRMVEEGAPFSVGALSIRGDEVMEVLNMPPSAQVGELLHALWMHCAAQPSDNRNDRLRRLCRTYASRKKP